VNVIARHSSGAKGSLELVVLVAGRPSIHALPASGSLSVGRSQDNDIRVDDASVSRRHAILDVAPLRIKDLGSANGTRIREVMDLPGTAGFRDTKVEPGSWVDIALGTSIGLGSTLLVVRRAGDARPEGATPSSSPDGFVVRDEAMRKLHELATRVAEGNISVLVLGETGAGKEVLAETIHRRSPRASKPFLRLNCAALSATLLESELFGHERGAFTGAVQAKPGLLETADGGTVFLDEVGEIPLETQVKLLRVLEERCVTRVGGLTPRPIDVRFVSATNRDLSAEVQRSGFRQDLYFRLAGITLTVPPLRARAAEIEPLARMFGARAAASMRRPEPTISREALTELCRYGWPGNVRELRNVMERAVVLAPGTTIFPEHLLLAPAPALEGAPARAAAVRTIEAPSASLHEELGSIARQRIIDALEACAGNQTQAALMLGMPRRTFVARLDEYGIPRPRKGTKRNA
jgi:two-component system, NtrC family, response regulator AtoC